MLDKRNCDRCRRSKGAGAKSVLPVDRSVRGLGAMADYPRDLALNRLWQAALMAVPGIGKDTQSSSTSATGDLAFESTFVVNVAWPGFANHRAKGLSAAACGNEGVGYRSLRRSHVPVSCVVVTMGTVAGIAVDMSGVSLTGARSGHGGAHTGPLSVDCGLQPLLTEALPSKLWGVRQKDRSPALSV